MAASEGEERAAWALWRILRPSGGRIATEAELEGARRALGEAEFRRVAELARLAGERPKATRRGGIWRAAGELRRAVKEVGESEG